MYNCLIFGSLLLSCGYLEFAMNVPSTCVDKVVSLKVELQKS